MGLITLACLLRSDVKTTSPANDRISFALDIWRSNFCNFRRVNYKNINMLSEGSKLQGRLPVNTCYKFKG